MHRRFIEPLCVCAAALALALLFTYPLVLRLDRAQRIDSGDGQLSVWNVAWVAHALTTSSVKLYDTNIFHPHRSTLAYSESNIGAGVMAAPVYWLTGNVFLAYNFAFLIGGFVASAISAYALTRYLTGSREAAVFAGIAFAFCPFIFARLPHIQLQLTFGIPLSMLALHRLVDGFDPSHGGRPDRTPIDRAVLLGLVLWAQALSCAYYGIFAGLTVGLGVLFYAWSRGLWRQSAWWIAVVIAAAISIGLVLPFFMPYLEVQEAGFTRSLDEARRYSADYRSWLVSAAPAHRWMLPFVRQQPPLPAWKEVLFPGFLPIAFTFVGVWAGLRPRFGQASAGSAAQRVGETTVLYLLILVLALWLSFGPDAGLYTLLFHAVPIFSFLRAPARMAIVVQLALAVLGAIGLTWVSLRWRSRARLFWAAAIVVLLAELNQTPLVFRDAPPLEGAYEKLRQLRPAPIAAFPFFDPRANYPRHTYYMLQSVYYWPKMINGYSDHIPPDFRAISESLNFFPNREAFRILRRRGVRYLIFHTRHYEPRNLELVREGLARYTENLTPHHISQDSWLYEITKWPE